MKILAPIASVRELEMLLHCGADELYFGVRTPEWEEHFGGKWWMNRRDPSTANLGSWREIQEMVGAAQKQNVATYVTLNAPFYTEGGLRYLLKLARRLVQEVRVHGLIVSDLNFLMMLAQESLPVKLHLSSLGSCINSEAVSFYQSTGISRVILPRQLRLSEIEHLIKSSAPDMEFEVFAVNDGCFYEEGFCQVTHAFGPFCLTDWDIMNHPSAQHSLSQKEIDRYRKRVREYQWFQNNCGSSFQENGLPNGPCSLCWFGHFRDWGVAAVKIVGREASFHRKMGSIQLVKAVMDEARGGATREQVASLARTLRNTPDYCNKGYMCYFRDSRDAKI